MHRDSFLAITPHGQSATPYRPGPRRFSQRDLAARAGTAQSVVARIESGTTSPTIDTLTRLLSACGFTLDVQLALDPVQDTHMLDDVARILALTPEQRFAELANASRFMLALRGGAHA